MTVKQRSHHPVTQQVFLASCHQKAVSPLIDSLGPYSARSADTVTEIVPYGSYVAFDLRLVCLTRSCEDIRLYRTFISTHLYHLHLHSKLIKQSFIKRQCPSKSVNINNTLRIKPHRVSHRGKIIIGLGVCVAIRHNPFPGILEAFQGVS